MKKIFAVILVLTIILTACTNKEFATYELDYFYFDTPISIKIYSYDDLDTTDISSEIEEMLVDLEMTFSPTEEQSLAYKLNDTGSITANEYMLELTTLSIDSCLQSNGDIDITSRNLIDIWSINNDNNIPTDDQIDNALQTIDCNNIVVNGDEISLLNGAKVDYGSVTKGYAADKIEQLLRAEGYNNALINLGGNVQLVNDKPDGSEFVVAVMTPDINNVLQANALELTLTDMAVVTSGINQRYFVGKDGTIYHHLLDLDTGYPSETELASVTIITEVGYDADSLSTAIFMLGLNDGYEKINEIDGVEAIFITRDKNIYSTTDNYNISVVDDNYELHYSLE